jgi:hypothetical protein
VNLKERALAGALPWRGGSSRILCHPVPQSSSEEGTSAGDGSSVTPTATSRAAVSYVTEEPATALPPDSVEGSPTARRTPMAGRPRVRESAWSVLETLGTNNAG